MALAGSLGSAPASAQDANASAEHIKAVTSAIDSKAIEANATTTNDWLSYGLDYAETRFSKLDKINDSNVKDLGLMWTYNLESIRGVEATPLVVDGIMYVTASWSVVHAVDGVNFEVLKGETLGVVGESGCGKSTTARLLMHLMPHDSGDIIYDGMTVGRQLSLREHPAI